MSALRKINQVFTQPWLFGINHRCALNSSTTFPAIETQAASILVHLVIFLSFNCEVVGSAYCQPTQDIQPCD